MNFAQRMDVEFRHDKAAIAAKSATVDTGRFYHLPDTRIDHMAQLGAGSRTPHAARCN